MPIQWTEDLSVDEPELDEQHKILFAIVNEVEKAAEGGCGAAAYVEALGKLLQYAAHHFSAEERYMRDIGLPEQRYAVHVADHKMFRDKVAEMTSGGVSVDDKMCALLKFLNGWSVKHIGRLDREFAEFRRRSG